MTSPISPPPQHPSKTKGQNHFEQRAIDSIVRQAVLSVPGVCAQSKMTGRSLPRIDVAYQPHKQEAAVEVRTAVQWPAPAAAIGEAIQTTVKAWVQSFFGIKVTSVSVVVSSFERDKRLAHSDIKPQAPALSLVAAAPDTPALRPILVKGTEPWHNLQE